jgi:hypothetical protein
MNIPTPLVAALYDYVATNMSAMSPDAWQVSDRAWRTLRTGFEYERYAINLPQQNIELKRHLAKCWANSSLDEKIRLATWIVRDWGGIYRNSEMTILGYVNQADAERPATPFSGIASYSKILGVKDPERYAVFDARVAASLNAIQLMLFRDGILRSPDLLAFAVPPGRNEIVNRFDSVAFPTALKRVGFTFVPRAAIYGTYLAILRAIHFVDHESIHRIESILEIEMFLFAQADKLCEKAIPLVQST